MKKKSLQILQLNKNSISNLSAYMISGGSETLINFNCRTTNASFCECDSEGCNTHTIDACEQQASEYDC
jgi:hypothetical protein